MTKASRLMLGNILVVAGGIALTLVLWLMQTHSHILEEGRLSLEKELAIFRHLLEEKGEFRIAGGKLVAGDYVINGNFEVPDLIERTLGGTATVFMGNVRVSTTLLNADGSRAVGTRLQGPACEALFVRHKGYRGEVTVFGVPYLTAYEPIRNGTGEVIGALHVGRRIEDLLSSHHEITTDVVAVGALIIAGFSFLSAALFREMRNSEERYRTVFEATGTATMILEESGIIHLANSRFATLAGGEKRGLEGVHWSTFVRAPDLERISAYHRDRRLDPASAPASHEFRFFPRNATPRDVLCTVSMIPGTSRSVVSLTDLTELKAAEKELKLAQLSLDNAQACIYRISEEGKILFANEAASRNLGYSREELLAMTIHDLDPNYPPERWPGHWEELKRKKTMLFESNHRTRTGEIIPTEVAVTYVGFGGEGHNFASVRDISERKQAYSLLDAEKQVLERIAAGEALEKTLAFLCTRFGELLQDGLCSVFLTEGDYLRQCAAPGLPEEFNAALQRIEIGPDVGSCGTAVFRKEEVIVTDIAADPLWERFRDLPLRHGLRACWSKPIVSAGGKVYGTFGVYHRTPRGPHSFELQAISHAVDLARIAIERRRSEDRVRETERRQKAILDNIPDLVWLKDREGRFGTVNKAFADACALSPEAMVGRTDFDVWPLDLATAYRVDDEETMTSLGHKQVEELFEEKGGKRVWIETIKTAIHDEEGRVVGTTGVARNIDTRKKTEQALRESEERFRQIFHQNEDAVFLLDLRSFEIIDINPMAEELYGYGREELLLRAPWDLLPPAELQSFTEAIDRLPRERGFHLDRVESLHRDGRRLTVAIWAKVIQLHDDEVLYCSVRDITERVRIEEEMKATQGRLIHANKMASLGMLVSGIAHEINNPNNFIGVNAALLQDIWGDVLRLLGRRHAEGEGIVLGGIPFDELETTVPRLLGGVSRGSTRIAAIVQNLRDFARNDPRGLDGTVDIARVVDEAILILTHQIHSCTDRLETEIPPGLPLIRGSHQQLEQVVINLLTNALQSLPARSNAVRIRAAHEGDAVVVRVADEGKGMSAETLRKLTEPFFSTRLDEGGTGLGLFISDSIVRAHGGTLQFDSEPGAGTTVSVRLPAIPPAPITSPFSETSPAA